MIKKNSIKKILKIFIPNILLSLRYILKKKKLKFKYKNYSTQKIFIDIYKNRLWGMSKNIDQKFYSGEGSRNISIVSKYIDAVDLFLKSFPNKPDVVDLGCGDFFVGSQIRPLCNSYIACDIVPSLIEYNKKKFKTHNVDFRTLDLIKDKLPSANIAFLRQVLQHLSNNDIREIIPKLIHNYEYLIVTEHLPVIKNFSHNLDISTGGETRIPIDSGVVLTSSPFNLEIENEKSVLKVFSDGGEITTTIYKLKKI